MDLINPPPQVLGLMKVFSVSFVQKDTLGLTEFFNKFSMRCPRRVQILNNQATFDSHNGGAGLNLVIEYKKI